MLKAKSLSSLPGIRHAFFSRAGGVSTGVYEGLNGGTGSSDKPEHIAENRARMAREYIAPRPIDMEWATAFVHVLRDGDDGEAAAFQQELAQHPNKLVVTLHAPATREQAISAGRKAAGLQS